MPVELLGLRDGRPQLLDPARRPDQPGVITEVPLDLADDRRHGELQEIVAAPRLPALDGLDQAEAGELFQIAAFDAAAGVPGGQ